MKVILHQLLFQKLICRSHSYKTEAPYRSESPDPLGQEAYYMPPWQLFLPTPFHKPISLQITKGDFRPMGKGVNIFILQKKRYTNKLSQKNRNREITSIMIRKTKTGGNDKPTNFLWQRRRGNLHQNIIIIILWYIWHT